MATVVSSREFNQDASRAKRSAAEGPVFITDRGKPAHVLLTYEAYQALVAKGPSLAEALAQKDGDDIEFEIPRMGNIQARVPDLD